MSKNFVFKQSPNCFFVPVLLFLTFSELDVEQIFSQRRGQWRAATQSQEFFRTLQRYYSNAYMDAEKQDAINV